MPETSKSDPRQEPSTGGRWITLGYGLMIAGTIGIFFLIRAYGETLAAPAPAEEDTLRKAGSAPAVDVLFHVLLILGAVIVVGRFLSRLFQYIGQPSVIGEVV